MTLICISFYRVLSLIPVSLLSGHLSLPTLVTSVCVFETLVMIYCVFALCMVRRTWDILAMIPETREKWAGLVHPIHEDARPQQSPRPG